MNDSYLVTTGRVQHVCEKAGMPIVVSPCLACDVGELSALLERACGALADIGWSQDMTPHIAQNKARRVYKEITARVPPVRENGEAD